MGAAAIAHEYTARDDKETGKLGELAAARCKVKPGDNEDNVIVVFFKDGRTVPSVVLEILDPATGEVIDLVELEKPMQEHRVGSLAEIGEISVPEVPQLYSRESAISLLESYGCSIHTSGVRATVDVYTQSGNPVTITFGDKSKITIQPYTVKEVRPDQIVSIESSRSSTDTLRDAEWL